MWSIVMRKNVADQERRNVELAKAYDKCKLATNTLLMVELSEKNYI